MSDVHVRIGLIGCGRIGAMHAGLLALPDLPFELVAVFDEVAAAAGDLAARTGARAASSAAELIDDERVEAVAICASTDAAAGLVCDAVAASKPVFVEKPVAFSVEPIDRAIEAAAATDTCVQVGFNRRFDPHHGAVARNVRDGAVGELEVLRITSRDPAPPPAEYVARSGGIFVDMAIHDFDMARFVAASDVTHVSTTGACLVDPAIGDAGDFDTASITLTHDSGALCVIDLSRRAVYGYDQRVEAFGSAGMVASANPPLTTVVRTDAAGAHGAAVPEFFIERYMSSYRTEWLGFVAQVRGEASTSGPMPTLVDARAALAIAAAAGVSARTGETVAVD